MGGGLIYLPQVSGGGGLRFMGILVSAGESVEAIDFTGKTDMEHEGGFLIAGFLFLG